MPFRKFRKFSFRKKRSNFRRKTSRKPRVSQNVKRYVKRIVHAQIENKQYSDNQGLFTPNFTTSGTVPTALVPLSPAISVGTGNGFRVGDKVRIMRAMLHINVVKSQAALNSGDVPSRIQFVIGRTRASPATTPNASDMDQLYWVDGGATDTFESGAVGMFWRPFNKGVWDVRYRSKPHKIGNANGNNASAATNPGYNNDFSLVNDYHVNLTKIFPKVLKFYPASSSSSNCFWYLFVFIQKVDFTTSATNWSPPAVSTCVNFEYEDA